MRQQRRCPSISPVDKYISLMIVHRLQPQWHRGRVGGGGGKLIEHEHHCMSHDDWLKIILGLMTYGSSFTISFLI